jgi:hypothetical protein
MASRPVRVRPHGGLVRDVHDSGLHVAARVPDLLSDLGQCLLSPADEGDSGSFARERARYRRPDRPRRAVDDRGLVL